MNTMIEIIKNHRSIRKYKDQMISDEMLSEIINAAQADPNSTNAQQLSIVAVKNNQTKKEIAAFSGGNAWINEAPVFLIFVMDYYKANIACEMNNRKLVVTDSVDSIIMGSIDAGIAMQNAVTAAESLKLGTVCIGCIRNNPAEIIKILNLPNYTFPLVGLCIGYPDQNPSLKPRMPKSAYFHMEKYKCASLVGDINNYDDVISNYLIGRNEDGSHSWSLTTSQIYQEVK